MPRVRSASLASSIVLLIAVLSVGSAAADASGAGGGRQLWVARYDGRGHGDDLASAMARSGDGSVIYVTGRTWAGSANRDDLTTVAYGSGGARRWVRTYDGRAHGFDVARAIAAGPSRVYVTGQTNGGPTLADYVTIAYTSGGIRLWTRRYDRSHGTDAASDIAVSRDGSTVFVTGSTATIAYRSDGTRLWVDRSVPGEHIAVAPDGSKVFAARIDGNDVLTLGIDAASGEQLWSGRYPAYAGSDAHVAGVEVSPDGQRVFVVGAVPAPMGETQSHLIAYDMDGNQVWSRDSDWYELARCLAVRPDGKRIYVAGPDLLDGTFLRAYDRAGTERYAATPWSAGAWPGVTAMVPAPAGVYLTGTTDLVYGAGDYVTTAVSADGAERWTASYDGPALGDDQPVGIVVSPDGSTVFVTGSSTGIGTGTDFATVAYRTG
jgi:hypothetical protein